MVRPFHVGFFNDYFSRVCKIRGTSAAPPLSQVLPVTSTLSRITEFIFISVPLSIGTSVLIFFSLHPAPPSFPVLLSVHRYNPGSRTENTPWTREIDAFGGPTYIHIYSSSSVEKTSLKSDSGL